MTRTVSLFGAGLVAAFFSTASAVALNSASQPVDLSSQFRRAALPIPDLRAFEIGGIVVIRGHATNRAAAEQAGAIAENLGYKRVANLVQVVAPPDDAAIRREAERALAFQRSLDGCKLRVDSHDGIVRVAGTVAEDIQKDEVVAVLRSIDGVREVHADLQR